MPSNNALAFLVLLLSLLACGCEEAPPPNVDLSSPKSTALVYLVALQHADARTARSVSIGTYEQKQWVDDLATLVDGMRKYNNALYTKFGRIVLQIHTDLEEGLRVLVDEPVALVRDGKVVSNDQEARIDLPHRGFTADAQLPVWLRHEKQVWKVDLVKTYADQIPPARLGEVTKTYHRMRRFGEVFQAVAGDVLAGRFRTVDEANQSLLERMRAAKGQP